MVMDWENQNKGGVINNTRWRMLIISRFSKILRTLQFNICKGHMTFIQISSPWKDKIPK